MHTHFSLSWLNWCMYISKDHCYRRLPSPLLYSIVCWSQTAVMFQLIFCLTKSFSGVTFNSQQMLHLDKCPSNAVFQSVRYTICLLAAVQFSRLCSTSVFCLNKRNGFYYTPSFYSSLLPNHLTRKRSSHFQPLDWAIATDPRRWYSPFRLSSINCIERLYNEDCIEPVPHSTNM